MAASDCQNDRLFGMVFAHKKTFYKKRKKDFTGIDMIADITTIGETVQFNTRSQVSKMLSKVGEVVEVLYNEKTYIGRVVEYKRGRESVLMVIETEKGFRSMPLNKVSVKPSSLLF